MKKIITVSFVAVLALTMLLPVAWQVNAASVNHSVLRQGGNPIPPGHYQGGNPIPPGHYQGAGH
jgi:hypothetical protein